MVPPHSLEPAPPPQQQPQQQQPPPPPPPPSTSSRWTPSKRDFEDIPRVPTISQKLESPQPETPDERRFGRKNPSGVGVPDDVLEELSYPFRIPDDPESLFEKIAQVGEGNYG